MKKTFFAAMLILAASFVGAQTTSRLSFGLGGGASVAPTNVVVKYAPRPMGTFDFGYTLLGGVNESVNLGFRTGLNVVYAQNDLSTVLSERFATTDVYGNVYDYRISSPKVLYTQKQVNLEIPLMFAIENKGFYVNLGLKLQMPLWNTFTQTRGCLLYTRNSRNGCEFTTYRKTFCRTEKDVWQSSASKCLMCHLCRDRSCLECEWK